MNLRAVISLLGLASPSTARLYDPDANISLDDETSTVPPADGSRVPLLDPEGIGMSAVPPADVGASFADPEGGTESATSPGDVGAFFVDLEGANVAGNDLDVYANETQYDDLFVEADEVEAGYSPYFGSQEKVRLCAKTACVAAPVKCDSKENIKIIHRKKKGGKEENCNVALKWRYENKKFVSVKCPGLVITMETGVPLYLGTKTGHTEVQFKKWNIDWLSWSNWSANIKGDHSNVANFGWEIDHGSNPKSLLGVKDGGDVFKVLRGQSCQST
jgi:hypothetical protein